MKNVTIAAMCLLMLFTACCKDDKDEPKPDTSGDGPTATSLVTPELRMSVAGPLSPGLFTGVLEIYPCKENSSIYFGNYTNGTLSVFNGYYIVVDGSVYGKNNRELHLPIGTYNMVYWGTPKYEEPIYNEPAIISPGLTMNGDLSDLYFSLRPNNDGTYKPVYDLVYAVREANIGSEDLQASLSRVGAGLKVIVTQTDNSVFSDAVVSMEIEINSIAEKINFFTAEAVNMTKTVSFDLTRSSNGEVMSNATVMLFPSAPNPQLNLIITLADGTQHTLSKALTSTLSPNTRLTLNIVVGKILPDGSPGDFTIEAWNEESETIEFPIIN